VKKYIEPFTGQNAVTVEQAKEEKKAGTKNPH